MNFDFQAVMVLLVFITGIIWALDTYKWAPARQRKAAVFSEGAEGKATEEQIEQIKKEPWYVEYSRSFFPIILIVLILRSFLVEPFRIPSGSMLPTLLVGDFILVNKYAYGVRLPVLGTKIVDVGKPERGDVVVFRYPKDPSVDYIKRVIGLPGDRIGYFNKRLYINGTQVKIETQGVYQGSDYRMIGLNRYIEYLDDVDHNILLKNDQRTMDGEFNIIPEGHYFVMGDNRDNSNDSRFWGTVPEENLVGKAFLIWMSWDSVESTIKWGRLGSSIE